MPALTMPESPLAQHDLVDGWVAFNIPAGASFLWQRFKVMRPGGSRRRGVRRAYRVQWNPLQGRLASAGDRQRFEEEQPAVYAALELLLSLSYGQEWLARHFTLDEIHAEVERLAAARTARAAARRRM